MFPYQSPKLQGYRGPWPFNAYKCSQYCIDDCVKWWAWHWLWWKGDTSRWVALPWKVEAESICIVIHIHYTVCVWLLVCVHISHTGICSWPGSSGDLLNSTFTSAESSLNHLEFWMTVEESHGKFVWSVQSGVVCFKDGKTLGTHFVIM